MIVTDGDEKEKRTKFGNCSQAPPAMQLFGRVQHEPRATGAVGWQAKESKIYDNFQHSSSSSIVFSYLSGLGLKLHTRLMCYYLRDQWTRKDGRLKSPRLMIISSSHLRVAQFLPIPGPEPQATYSPFVITYASNGWRDHGIIRRASEAVVRVSAFSSSISLQLVSQPWSL